MKIKHGKWWMIQTSARWAGPINFGIHVSIRRGAAKYIDIHLPYTVITIGDITKVEYPPFWWSSAKDKRTGVEYGN